MTIADQIKFSVLERKLTVANDKIEMLRSVCDREITNVKILGEIELKLKAIK